MYNVECRMYNVPTFMKPNPLQDKSYAFAIRIVKAVLFLQVKKREFVLTKQLLRSGTSIGANIEEGLHSQSKPEFIAKLQIAIKEAYESDYWIRLLRDTGFLTKAESASLLSDLLELEKLLTTIIKTSRRNKE